MRLNQPWMTRAISWPFELGLNAWMRTLQYRALFANESLDPIHSGGQPRIYLFWHESILFPLYLRGNCNLSMLLSKHRDADLLERIAQRFGFGCVRGSTARGGAQALRELAQRSASEHLTITPDGPRGPRRRMAPGPIYLASKLGMPIVVMGFAYSHPWRLRSWDRFAIPKPYSRARVVLSDEIIVPTNLDRDGVEWWRQLIEASLNALTEDAQEWASSGAARNGQRRISKHNGLPPLPPSRSVLKAA